MKKMAGITTAVTGIGTVTSGIALGTGIAKTNLPPLAQLSYDLNLLKQAKEYTESKKQQIDECLASIKTLSNVRMQARIAKTATDTDLARTENIIHACDAWTTVDVSSINNRSKGATVAEECEGALK